MYTSRTLNLLTMFIVAACSSTHELKLDETGTSVELDMFSGRPNPVWQLTAEEIAQLEARLSDLREAPGMTSDRLGYRGFVIRSRSGPDIRVYSGSIFFENAVYADVHDAEAWLVAYAERKGVKVRTHL